MTIAIIATKKTPAARVPKFAPIDTEVFETFEASNYFEDRYAIWHLRAQLDMRRYTSSSRFSAEQVRRANDRDRRAKVAP